MVTPAIRIASATPRKRALPVKKTFTIAMLERLQPAAGEDRIVIWDTRVPRLQVVARATGTKSFYLYAKVAGRPQRLALGTYPQVSIDLARELATKGNAEIAHGRDPMQARRSLNAEATFAELWTAFMERHVKPHLKSADEYAGIYRRHLSPLGPRRLSTIKPSDISALVHRIGTKGRDVTLTSCKGKTTTYTRPPSPVAANRCHAVLSSAFNFARTTMGFTEANPTTGIKRFKERTRERFLQPDELERFFAALEAMSNPTMRDLFKLCLFTGARRDNVQAMAWSDVNLDAGLWKIPDTKSGEPVTIPLSPPAKEVLEARHAMRTTSPYVFASHAKRGYIAEPKLAWRALCNVAKLENLHMHDLRRTLGSWQAATGASLSVIGRGLGHKSLGSTAIYARLNVDPVRTAIDTATAAMLSAGNVKPPAKGKGKAKTTVTKPE